MNKKAVLMDLDGTIYRESYTIPGAAEWVDYIKGQSLEFLFVTNNAMRAPEVVAGRLVREHGISASPLHVYTSVDAVTYCLDQDTADQTDSLTAYVLGRAYLKQAVAGLGITVKEGKEAIEQANLVVVGLDQELSYAELANACLLVQHGADFYLTNPDIRYPNERGFVPGCGTLGKVIESVALKSPIICGKPEKVFMKGALSRLGVRPDEAVMIGDNLETDILAANRMGMTSILIETGVHTHEDCQKLGIYPTCWVKNYEELRKLWEKG